MLLQVKKFLLECKSKQLAQNLFNNISKKASFPSENKLGIFIFEFSGVVTDYPYNGVNIVQMPDYIEISCKNYIGCLLKLY